MEEKQKKTIRNVYLYLFSFIGLVLIIIGCIQLTNLALKVFVFKGADQPIVYPLPRPITDESADPDQDQEIEQQQMEYQAKERSASRQRTAASALAMIIIGAPLYLYHWRAIQKADTA